jgi:hypothetical protein
MADGEGDVEDPVLGTMETYRATVEELGDLIKGGFEKILKLARPNPEI